MLEVPDLNLFRSTESRWFRGIVACGCVVNEWRRRWRRVEEGCFVGVERRGKDVGSLIRNMALTKH